MKIIEPYFRFSDDRGGMLGIVNEGEWQEINLVDSQAGAVRGGHYHRRTRELFHIIDGRIRVEVTDLEGRVLVERHVSGGDTLVVEPGEVHTFHCETPCRWINVLSRRIDPEAPDIWRPEGGAG